jgi:2-C-methyl-D-erythritol 4-phosphate cytidylyltransferase
MNYSVLIVAGGKGERMGLGYNKVFYPIKEGKTVLDMTVKLFVDDVRCKQLVIVTNPHDLHKVMQIHEMGRIVNVGGGLTRQDSVHNGLMCVTEEVVLVHDAARPYCTIDLIDELLLVMETEQAAFLAIDVKDTVKEVKNGYVVKTINRECLKNAQTPQAFKTNLLLNCIRQAQEDNFKATDDAQLIERYSNVPIKVVKGSYDNIKITTPEDVR